jgi:hypothetical protein
LAHEFTVDRSTESTIEIRHIGEGHCYAFHVSNDRLERRSFRNPIVREGPRAAFNSKYLAAKARLFAEREGRIANIID